MSNSLAITYVHHGDKSFCVSTIDRDSSAMEGGHYAETLVWEWDKTTRERGAVLGMTEGPEGTLLAHFHMVQRLHDTGQCEVEEVEETGKVAA